MKDYSYAREPDGEWEKTETEVPDDDTPLKRRVKALAEAQPGRIAVGFACDSPQQSVEIVDYLEELGAESL